MTASAVCRDADPPTPPPRLAPPLRLKSPPRPPSVLDESPAATVTPPPDPVPAVAKLDPAATLTSPPDTPVPDDTPDAMLMTPAVPAVELPIFRSIEPTFPLSASPVSNEMVPLEPLPDRPVPNTTDPVDPSTVSVSADRTFTPPVSAWPSEATLGAPLSTSTEPLTPDPVVPPRISTRPPSTMPSPAVSPMPPPVPAGSTVLPPPIFDQAPSPPALEPGASTTFPAAPACDDPVCRITESTLMMLSHRKQYSYLRCARRIHRMQGSRDYSKHRRQ